MKLGDLKKFVDDLGRSLRGEARDLNRKIEAVWQGAANRMEEMGGQLAEFGNQLFSIHLVQEMLCEKTRITPEQVKERLDARQAAIEEQERLLREKADEAREKALETKEAAKAAPADTTEQPVVPAEVLDGTAPAGSPDQDNLEG